MARITVADITPAALLRFSMIDVSAPNETRRLWEDRKVPPWTDPNRPIPLTEDGTVYVASLEESELEPIRSAVIAAGGERGLIA